MTGSAPPRSHLSREVPAAAALLALGVGGRAVFAAVLLLVVEPRVNELVVARDEPPPHVSRFPLEVAGMIRSFARCAVESGEVTSLEWR